MTSSPTGARLRVGDVLNRIQCCPSHVDGLTTILHLDIKITYRGLNQDGNPSMRDTLHIARYREINTKHSYTHRGHVYAAALFPVMSFPSTVESRRYWAQFSKLMSVSPDLPGTPSFPSA